MYSDEMLLERYAKHRDADAFALLVNRYAGLVYGTCLRITSNPHDAEDVFQECFLELAKRAGDIRSCLPAWLHKVAKNKSINAIRGQAVRRRREAEAMAEEMDSSDPSWDDIAVYVDEAVEKLPEQLRVPLVLHYFHGMTQSQVAVHLGISQATVSRRLEKGVQELREALKKSGVAPIAVAVIAVLLADQVSAAVPESVIHGAVAIGLAGIGAPPAGGALSLLRPLSKLAKLPPTPVVLIVAVIVPIAGWVDIHPPGSSGRGRAVSTTRSAVTLAGIVSEMKRQESLCGASLVVDYAVSCRNQGSSSDIQGLSSGSRVYGTGEGYDGSYRYIRTPDMFRIEETSRSVYNDRAAQPVSTTVSSFDRMTGGFRTITSASGTATGEQGTGPTWPVGRLEVFETVAYPLYEGLLYDEVARGTIIGTSEKIDGHDCVKVELPSGSPRRLANCRVWLDPRIGYNPRKIEFVWRDKKPTEVTFLDYTTLAKGVWFPRRQIYEYGIRGSQTSLLRETKVITNVSIGKNLSTGEVAVTFPSGTEAYIDGKRVTIQ